MPNDQIGPRQTFEGLVKRIVRKELATMRVSPLQNAIRKGGKGRKAVKPTDKRLKANRDV